MCLTELSRNDSKWDYGAEKEHPLNISDWGNQ